MGSSDTFGKFVQTPFAAVAENEIGTTCVNLGCVNAGVDSFLNDAGILRVAGAGSITVLQVMGAQNLSNRYYRVHQRRNDRFLEPTALLTKLYGEVDFADIHFNKHLLSTLAALSPKRFETIRQDLKAAWLGRMRLLLQALGPRTLLVWVRHAGDASNGAVGSDPLLVSRDMLDQLSSDTLGMVEVDVQPAGRTDDLEQMHFGPLQAPAAEQAIGPSSHVRISKAVVDALRPHL